MRVGEVGRRLQQQRGLADARLAAKQHQRTGDNAAAEHAIEFADTRGDAIGLRCFNLRVLLRRPAPPPASHSDAWSGRPSRLRTGAPRQTSSTRRSRRTCPATSGAGRRTPDTRILASLLHDEAFRGHGEVRRTRRMTNTESLSHRQRQSPHAISITPSVFSVLLRVLGRFRERQAGFSRTFFRLERQAGKVPRTESFRSTPPFRGRR